jgi:hypothetical protein
MVWQDQRLSTYDDIFAQRIDKYGRPLWEPDGIVVCDETSIQSHPRIASDGQGGAVMVWWDQRNGGSEIYAQRIDASGNAVWATDGVRVFGYTWSVDYYDIDGDGFGGALITWNDMHADFSNQRVYAQRLAAADGSRLWGDDGLEVSTFVSQQQFANIVATGGGGALLVWSDGRNGNWDIYGQWIHADGSRTWGNGLSISTAAGGQWQSQACSDGRGGIIAAWQDMRNDIYYDIYAAGFDTNLAYTFYDVPVCTAPKDQTGVVLAPDGQGGAYLAWYDERPEYGSDIYAQRITRSNYAEWQTDGIPVCDEPGYQSSVVMTSDGFGGAVLAWSDARSGTGGSDVYGHRLGADGISDWTTGGVLLCHQSGTGTVGPGGIVPDGGLGGIVVWHDSRSSPNWDIYAQRVERSGYWGYPSPWIDGVADVPFDQGGQITITWDASRLDVLPEEIVTHYSVWRSLDEGALAAKVADDARGVRLSEVAFDFDGPAFLLGEGKSAGAWEWLANLPSHWFDEYAYTAATLNDSTATNPGWHHFFVAAHTSDPFIFWDSLPDSGYSVDNLAPTTPAGLEGQADFDLPALYLSWRPNTEPDLAGYRVYRGTDPTFDPDASHLIVAVVDTVATDSGWNWESGFYYKVTAIDVHGNESFWAGLAPTEIAGSEDPPVVVRPFLANHPNPFNPLTKITYALDQPAEVVLRILDARGREVAVLREGRQQVGRHAVEWDGRDMRGRSLPSGMYFCRLEAGSLRLVHKMSLVR